MTDTVPFEKWFDLRDREHVAALETLINSGEWPTGFVPAHVTRDSGWRERLEARIVRDWIFLVQMRISEIEYNLTGKDFEDL